MDSHLSEEEMQEMYAIGYSVENVGFKSEEDVRNIDLFTELQLLKYAQVDWIERIVFDGDQIELDGKPIRLELVAGKYKLFIDLKKATKKMQAKRIEVKGKDKTAILVKWLSQAKYAVVLMSVAEWTQLLIPDLNMKLSINSDGFSSLAPYDAAKAYYKQERKIRYEMRHAGDELLQTLMRRVESKHESAYNEVDNSGRNEYDRLVIDEAVNVLEEYGIDCSMLVKGFA